MCNGNCTCGREAPQMAESNEKRLERELERAYNCIFSFYMAHQRDKKVEDGVIGYHSLTIGAAHRYVLERKLDGADYFMGKPVETLARAFDLGSEV